MKIESISRKTMKKNISFLIATIGILTLLAFKPTEKITIWMIGDSTMADKSPRNAPQTGWGTMLKSLVDTSSWIVKNKAINGRSSRSYLVENRWKLVYDNIKPGDYVIIQFGHNDSKPDTLRHTEPFTTYKQNLKRYIDDTKAKGGIPILCTSVVRRHFDSKGNLVDTHGDYLTAMKQVANETNTVLIDMEKSTRELVAPMGPELSKSLYDFTKPGEYPTRPKGSQDSTHLCVKGAKMFAELFIKEAKTKKIVLEKYLKK